VVESVPRAFLAGARALEEPAVAGSGRNGAGVSIRTWNAL
jgi:hypothetical protein